jgi:hypothetical protein
MFLYVSVILHKHIRVSLMGRGGRGGRSSGRGRTPNDDRSDSLNPNNPAYQASMDNRADQLNPNNPEYKGDEKDDPAS